MRIALAKKDLSFRDYITLLGENKMVSAVCAKVLEKPPKCFDFRGIRRWAMCRAWQIMETEKKPFKKAIKEAWRHAKSICIID